MIDYTGSSAVLIGVSHCEDENVPEVLSAARSLQEMRALLTDPDLCGWPEDRVTVIGNPLTASELAQRLGELAEQTTGTLLIYFVGHGALADTGELCLVVGETEIACPDLTHLKFRHFRSVVVDSPAKSKIVIFDCCYSDKVIAKLSADDTLLAGWTEIWGAYTLAAADRQTRTPPADSEQGTLFTEAFVGAVRKGLPGDLKTLTFHDIYPQLLQRALAAELPQPSQGGTDTILRYPFSRNAAFGKAAGLAPEPTPEPVLEPPPHHPRRRRRAWGVGISVLVVSVAVAWYALTPERKDKNTQNAIPSSAVPATTGAPAPVSSAPPTAGSPTSKPSTSVRAAAAAAPGDLDAVNSGGQVTVSWTAPDLAGGQFVSYQVSGTGLGERSVTTTDTTYTGVPGGSNITFTVWAITKTVTGQRLTGAPAVKKLAIPASPQITISRGADTGSAKCEKPDCSWINARLTGFQPGTTYQIYPYANGLVFSEPCVATADANGSATCDDVRYDVPDTNVFEYVNTPSGRIQSNVLHWERRLPGADVHDTSVWRRGQVVPEGPPGRCGWSGPESAAEAVGDGSPQPGTPVKRGSRRSCAARSDVRPTAR
ncbi:hypothetical protein AB0N89_02340 [Amycolatopsis sp. NPDC089917]|uniref:caspase, EACC1-associated type n=1 Tax=Amycolatopsis sp. NPDC089917 TaxID=3155187 RepID=UPI00342B014F